MAESNHQQSATSGRVETSLPDMRSRTAEKVSEVFKLMRQNRKRRRAMAKRSGGVNTPSDGTDPQINPRPPLNSSTLRIIEYDCHGNRKTKPVRKKSRTERERMSPNPVPSPVLQEYSSEQDDQQLYEDDQQLNDEADHAHGVETVEAENTATSQLDRLCLQIEADLEAMRSARISSSSSTPEWVDRVSRREESWEEIRPTIFNEVVCLKGYPKNKECMHCGKTRALIRCVECCAVNNLLCTTCDSHVHSNFPLHDREVWTGEYFKAVPPTTSIDDETMELITIERFWLVKPLWSCPACLEQGSLKVDTAGCKRVVITTKGRYDLDDCRIVCTSCGHSHGETIASVLSTGFWPGSVARNSRYLFSIELLKFFDLLQKCLPGTSIVGFIEALEHLSHSHGRISTINRASFTKSFEEFRYCISECKELEKRNFFECPACFKQQHSVHVDGNKKVYRYSKVARGVRDSYYHGSFRLIVENDKVDSHLQQLGYTDNTDSGMCGTSRWKAAKAVSKGMKNLDETGLIVAGCWHTIAQSAVNMFRGEIYGYTHYLHSNVFPKKNIKFFWQDVACQYWGYAEKVTPANSPALQMTPCLPVMHAKAHTWHCQVLWGGRWQDGAAAGAGEDMEQFFSYLSRWSSPTKSMLAYRREEFLTEATAFWNSRKISSLPKMLVHRLQKTQRKLLRLEEQLNEISIHSAITLNEEILMTYKNDVQAAAKGCKSVAASLLACSQTTHLGGVTQTVNLVF